MRRLLKRMFWPEPHPVTRESVEPAPLPEEMEKEARRANYQMTETVLTALNRSRDLRVRLAEETLAAVSGARR